MIKSPLVGIARILAVIFFSALLTACGGGGSSSSGPSNAVVGGSVGDGPVTGATVRIFNARGVLVSVGTSDNTATYRTNVKAYARDYPLVLKVSDGIDLVTGEVPDFEMVSVKMCKSCEVANINPFTTLIVKMAEHMAGGINSENIEYAKSLVMEKLGFGLDPDVISDPMTEEITGSTIAQIVKSSEAMGEMVRRTRDQLMVNGEAVSGDDVVNALAADMADGFLDGAGAEGADAKVTAVVNVVSGQVLVEAMQNTLKVNGVPATEVMDQAILATHPSIKSFRMIDSVRITSSMIRQTRQSVAAAQAVDDRDQLKQLARDLDDLDDDSTSEEVAAKISGNASRWLGNTVAYVSTAGEQHVSAINRAANDVPDYGRKDPVVDAAPPPPVKNTPPVVKRPPPVVKSPPPVVKRPPPVVKSPPPVVKSPAPVVKSPPPVVKSPPPVVKSPPPVVVKNTPPKLAGSPAASAVATKNYSFTPSANDVDGDKLTFSISNKPVWASFNTSTGRLDGVPFEADVGSYKNIVISVSDGKSKVSLGAFSVQVKTNVAATGSLNLNWTAPVARADGSPLSLSAINGYRVYYGTTKGDYPKSVNVNDGTATSVTVTGIPVGSYHVVMTTYDVDGRESGYSPSVVKAVKP